MPKFAKLYEWRGVDSLSLPLTIDGVRKVVTFPAGREKPLTHAQYRTESEEIQKAIEATTFFESGQIKEKAKYPIVELPAGTKPAVESAPKVKKQPYPSVTNIQLAADKLIEKYNIPATELTNPDDILAKAEEVGAVFPNLPTDNIL